MSGPIVDERGVRYRTYKEYGKDKGFAVAEDFLGPDDKPEVYTLTLKDVTEKKFPGRDDEGNPKLDVKQVLWFKPSREGKRPPRPIVCGKEAWDVVKKLLAKHRGARIDDWEDFRIAFTARWLRQKKWGIFPVASPDITEDLTVKTRLGKKGGGHYIATNTVRAMAKATSGPPTSRSKA
jgi:hypothetical protein